MTAPILTDFSTSVTFAENTVNAAPQLIDSDVTLTSSSTDFDGGTLSLTGLVAEDTVSVRNQGTNTGEIGLSDFSVTYAGTTIGTLAGGIAGSDLVITFNDAATAASIEALIENLTYANSSDTPTTSRDLQLNITGAAQDATFDTTALTGEANPLDGIDVGFVDSTPSFVDIDGDGDLDLVVGEYDGILNTYRNGTNTASGDFETLTGAANPFNGIDVGNYSNPSFVDLDGDGDLDLVVGEYHGTLSTYRNGTNGASGDFEALTGAANPLDGIDVGFDSTPSFVDIDGDGDLDLVVGEYEGILNTYRNGTNTASGDFETLTGAANPFNGIDVGNYSNPSFVDLDGDGDLDLVVGEYDGILNTYRNGTNTASGDFEALTGEANPLDGIDVGDYSTPSFVDLDGDGDLDLVVGESDGTLNTYENITPVESVSFTLEVTAEIDYGANVVSEGSFDLSGLNNSYNLTLSGSGDYYGYGNDNNNTIVGNSGRNTLKGNNGNDILQGKNGNDTLQGGNNNDKLYGGNNNDKLYGGNNNDKLYGGNGNDKSYGEAGNDSLYMDFGNDTLDGGSGADWLFVTGSTNSVVNLAKTTGQNTGFGTDIIKNIENASGGTGVDKFYGTTGNNTLKGNNGNDILQGKNGNDNLQGGNNNDKLYGGNNNDKLYGGNGNDKSYGEAGNDSLYMDFGNDTLDGGSGADWLFVTGSTNSVVNLAKTTGQNTGFGTDIIKNIENASGGTGVDKFYGTTGNNTLKGNNGNDILHGRNGNDNLQGG